MNRPKDIDGNEIVMGPWYWATNQRGDVIGTGKFAATIGFDEATFYLNGVGYDPGSFTFKRHYDTPSAIAPAELIEAAIAMRAKQKMRFVGHDVQILEYAFDKLVAAIQNPPAPNLFG